MIAVSFGNFEIVEALLKAGALYKNFPSRLEAGLCPLQMACRQANMNLVRYFLIAGADLNRPAAKYAGRTSLKAAVECGDVGLVRFLIKKGADVNAPPAKHEPRVTALFAAVQQKRFDLVQILLEAGADVNGSYSTCISFPKNSLQEAAWQGDNNLIRLLIDHGAHVN